MDQWTVTEQKILYFIVSLLILHWLIKDQDVNMGTIYMLPVQVLIIFVCGGICIHCIVRERERERERKRERERERERDSSNYCLFASDNTEYYILLNQK